MAEMKLQEKEQQEAFQAAPMPKGLQFFYERTSKKDILVQTMRRWSV